MVGSQSFIARICRYSPLSLRIGILCFAAIALLGVALPAGALAEEKDPIAAYPLDAGEGTVAEDVTGDGHEGTIEGAEWTNGNTARR